MNETKVERTYSKQITAPITTGAVRVERTYDEELIKSIMLHPLIFATVAEDYATHNTLHPDVLGTYWLKVISPDGVVIGLYQLIKVNAITLEIHAQIMPEYRKQYSTSSGAAILAFIYDDMHDHLKVVTQVPFLYDNVRRFTEQFGFKIEGINRKSYLKNGEVWDQWMMGITRDEIGEHLSWVA